MKVKNARAHIMNKYKMLPYISDQDLYNLISFDKHTHNKEILHAQLNYGCIYHKEKSEEQDSIFLQI
jgi:hypothetical protein